MSYNMDGVVSDALEDMSAIRHKATEAARAHESPTVYNVLRQFVDHLDASALFLQQLAMVIRSQEAMIEANAKEQIAQGNIMDFTADQPGGATNGEG